MAGDMQRFRESMKDLKEKIEAYMKTYGNSVGTLDKCDFRLILKDHPGFAQDNINICRIIAWNVQLYQDPYTMEEEVIEWANAMRVFRNAEKHPEVYAMDNPDPRYLNDIARQAMLYMQEEEPFIQANSYKTMENLEKFASDFDACRVFRKGNAIE